jgi:hypothetical protein
MTIELSQEARAQAVASIERRSQDERIGELDIEVHEDEFGYWRQVDAAARKGSAR